MKSFTRCVAGLLGAGAAVVTIGMLASQASAATIPTPAAHVVTVPSASVKAQEVACPLSYCSAPSKGNSAKVAIYLGAGYSSVSSVELTFHFKGDLLNPGEIWMLDMFGGRSNIDTVSYTSSTITLLVPYQVLTQFENTCSTTVTFFMANGSVYLTGRVDIAIIGTSTLAGQPVLALAA